mgnify:FL=1
MKVYSKDDLMNGMPNFNGDGDGDGDEDEEEDEDEDERTPSFRVRNFKTHALLFFFIFHVCSLALFLFSLCIHCFYLILSHLYILLFLASFFF